MSPCCTKTSITRPFLGRMGRNFYWNSPRHWSSTIQNFSPIGPKMAELRPIFQNFHWNAFFSSLLVTFWRGHGSLLKSAQSMLCMLHILSPCCTKTSITRPFLGRMGRNFYWNSPRHWSSTMQNFSPIGQKMAKLRPIFQNFHQISSLLSSFAPFSSRHGTLLKSAQSMLCM